MTDLIKLDMTQVWADTGDKVAPTNAKVLTGWVVESVPRQTWNWIENRQDQNIAYMLQKGIPEWDATTQYIGNKSYVQRNNIVYKAIATSTNSPPENLSGWVIAFVTSTAYLERIKGLTVTNNTTAIIDGTGAAVNASVSTIGRSMLNAATATEGRGFISAQLQSATLDTLSLVSPSTNTFPYWTGTNTVANASITAYGRSLVAITDAPAARTLLGLGNTSTLDVGTVAGTVAAGDDSRIVGSAQKGANLADLTNIPGARSNLGLTSAAITALTTSRVDQTVGRILKVGDFGFGFELSLTDDNLDNAKASGLWTTTTTPTPLPAGFPTGVRYTLIVVGGTSYATQILTNTTSGNSALRSWNGTTWGAWNIQYGSVDPAFARNSMSLTYPATAPTTGSGNVVLSASPVLTGAPTAPTAAVGASTLQLATTEFVQQNASANPPGTILAFAGTAIPVGYLLANGASLSRTTYAQLFGVIGTTYGNADASTFNIPDLRGEFLRGLDNGRGIDSGRNLGTFQNWQLANHTHTFVGDAIPAHTHTATASTDPGHTHPIIRAQNNNVGNGSPYYTTANGSNGYGANTEAAGSHAHTISVAAAGAGTPTGTITVAGGTTNSSESRPRNIAVQFLIKF